MKKKAMSVIRIVIVILMILVIAVALVTDILFSRSETPKIFGHYIYMMETDEMELAGETADPASATAAKAAGSTTGSIRKKTAVLAKEYNGTDPISINNPVLCKLTVEDTTPGRDSEGIAVRRIAKIEQDPDTGIQMYYPITMKPDLYGEEPAITTDSILGKCTYESDELYAFVTFTTSFKGILIMLALPCVILVVLLIVAIVRANAKDKDEDMAFEETYDEIFNEDMYDDEYDDEDLGATAPLYQSNPAANIGDTTSLQRKKSSIAQNFERKAVNPNSPYQKARTMQFKAQRNVPIYTAPQDQIMADEEESGLSSSFTNTFTNARQATASRAGSVEDLMQEPQQSPSAYRGSHEATSSGDVRNLGARPHEAARSMSSTTPAAEPAAPAKKPAAPATTKRAARYESASVDELLAMIENEKNKLK